MLTSRRLRVRTQLVRGISTDTEIDPPRPEWKPTQTKREFGSVVVDISNHPTQATHRLQGFCNQSA